MKRILLLFFVGILMTSCTKNKLVSEVTNQVKMFSECGTPEDWGRWFNQDEIRVSQDGITYSIHHFIYNRPGISVFIEEGASDYYKKELLPEIVQQVKDGLKSYSVVESVYEDDSWIVIELKDDAELSIRGLRYIPANTEIYDAYFPSKRAARYIMSDTLFDKNQIGY
ncbi:MAG: hypothetical protein MJZ81_02295 [Bacteroidales bacterium]|nr:hypothetical protein [Bacteroidales bacterium]